MTTQLNSSTEMVTFKNKMAELENEVKELTELNEEMLSKLSNQDTQIRQSEDLQERIDNVTEELENSQKANDYY